MNSIKTTHFRWYIVFLLFLITIVNYIDRSSISYAIDKMTLLFHLNQTQAGLILSAFGIGYVITTLLGGIAVDWFGAHKILFFAVLFWSCSMFMTGLATGFLMAFMARIALGFAEGPNFPGVSRAVSDWLPKHECAKALSFSLVAVPLAMAIGGPVVTQLIIHTSWRIMFFILGAVGLIWAPIWWFSFRDFPEQSRFVNAMEIKKIRENNLIENANNQTAYQKEILTPGLWKYLFSNPTLVANNWAFFVFGYALFFFMTWLPSYLLQQYHMPLKQIGLFSILPWTLSAILIAIVGYLSDWLLKKTDNYRLARTYPIIISQFLSALCIFPIIYSHHIYVALIFISLAIALGMSGNSAFYAVNIDVMKKRSGTAIGVMDAGFAISGFIAPAVTGWIVNWTGQYTSAFLLLAGLAFSSVIIVFLLHRPQPRN